LSTETAILIQLREINAKLDRLAARLDAVSPAPWPERLTTQEAVAYVRVAFAWPHFAGRTLRKWRSEGRLTRYVHPCRWDRNELDRECSGTPVSRETRGRRRTL
jgi:hypothetical protein